MRPDFRLALGLFVSLATFGCSTESEPTEPVVPNPGCAEEPCLATPQNGFQIRSNGQLIGPGVDVEYCEVVTLPGTPADTYYVNRFEVAMTPHSHHLIVAAIEPGTDTEAAAEVALAEGPVECTGPDRFGGEIIPVTGSQHPYHDDPYPPGVGRVYHGGQKLVFDYHYFNTTAAEVGARGAVNFHVADPESIDRIAQGFGFINAGIVIPAGGTAEFTHQCTFSQDVTVFQLTRHTHQWGRDFSVWFHGGERDGEHIFTSPDYETTDYSFEEPVLVPAGEGFRFSCAFENTTDSLLTFGLKATDEMCILFGEWFVPNDGDVPTDQSCITF
jgi:hypothetical protein